ncbi:MAG: PKD domain-containing protein, partial [Flavisolibacter sp.]
MKKLFTIPIIFIATLPMILASCNKPDVIQNLRPQPNPTTPKKALTANAGPDQVIFSPQDTVVLDGSASYSPDGSIIKWRWTILFGPHSGLIKDSNAAKTSVCNLIKGLYKFQLTVTDSAGAAATDVVQVQVDELPATPCSAVSRPMVKLTLTEIGRLSVPRIPTIAAVGNTIVFAGGYQSSLGGNTECTAAVDIYNIDRHEWVTAQLSQARQNMASVSCGNKIFFAGGENGSRVYDNVDVYDVAANSWTLMHLSEPRTAIAAKAVGTKVFFAGGTRDRIDGTRTVDIYDLATNAWTIAQLSAPDFNVCAVVDGNKIYFFREHLDDMGYLFDFYDVSIGTWSTSELSVFRGIFDANINGTTYWAGWGDSGGNSAYLSVTNK